MKTTPFLFFLFAILSCLNLSAQEICDNGIDDDGDGLIDLNDTTDCACPLLSRVESFFLNPSFEVFDNDGDCGSSQTNGAPDGPGQANCIAFWEQSSEATTDAWHLLTYNGNPPNWPGAIPQPIPSGVAVAGFFVGVSNIPEYREYLGACLPEGSIQEAVPYRLNFFLGFGEVTGNGVDSLIYSPPVEMAVYGITDCNLLRFDGRECPEVAGADGWELISTTTFSGAAGSWENATIDFTPDRDYAAIAIGGACTPVSGPPGANFWRRYYFIDDLILNTQAVFESTPTVGSIAVLGDDICDENSAMIATDFPDATYQWYRNGIAVAGATERAYYPALDENFPGLYSVRISRPDGCGIAGPVDLIRPVVTNAFRDSVFACPDGEAVIQPQVRGTVVQSYLWEDGSTEGTRIVSSPGEYTVTVTSFCEQTVETIVVTNETTPTYQIRTVPEAYCLGDTISVYLETDWQIRILVSDGAQNFEDSLRVAITNPPQNLTVVVFSNCFFQGQQPLVFSAPEIILPGFQPAALSCSNTSVLLNPGIMNGLENPVFTWRNAMNQIVGNEASLTVSDIGNYTLSVAADNIDCEGEASYSVAFSDTDQFVSLQQLPLLSCANSSGEIQLLVDNPDRTQLAWRDGSGTLLGSGASLLVSSPGIYSLTAFLLAPNSNDTICQQSEVFTVMEDLSRPLILSTDVPILSCENPVADIVVVADNPVSTQFVWSRDDGTIVGTTNSLRVSDPANFNLLAYILDAAGDTVCQEAIRVPVTLLSNFDFEFTTSIQDNCTGSSAAQLDLTSDLAEWTFSWFRVGSGSPFAEGAGLNQQDSLLPGNYRLRFQQNQYCRGDVNFTIEAIDELQLRLDLERLECPTPEDIDALSALNFVASGGTAPYRFLLNDNRDTIRETSLPAIAVGSYVATVFDAFGCTARSEVVELSIPDFLIVEAGPDQLINLGESTRLRAQSNQAVPTSGLNWAPEAGLSCTDCPNPTASPLVSTDYVLTYFTEDGCGVSDVVRVGVVPTGQVYIPTAFSPNGDGVNDLFQLFPDQSVAGITEFRVFDRWGGLVYEEDGSSLGNRGWDGRRGDGQVCGSGVYVYAAKVRLLNGESRSFTGSVSLLP